MGLSRIGPGLFLTIGTLLVVAGLLVFALDMLKDSTGIKSSGSMFMCLAAAIVMYACAAAAAS